MSQEQYHDLKKYIPESEMLRMVYRNMYPDSDITDWEKYIQFKIDDVLAGDEESLFDLLELTYMNAYNEGMIDEASSDYDQTILSN